MSRSVRIVVLTVTGLAAAASLAWPVSNLSDTNHWAWAENAGWVNAKATHGGVTVHAEYLSGWAWAENIGWIQLGADGGGPYGNTSASDWGVNRDGSGVLSGYGWSETVGWVNFSPTHGGGCQVDPVTGELSGYAWAENLGFVHLASATPGYGVQLVVPQPPTDLAADPPPGAWSSDSTVEVTFSGATGNDLGLGYSLVFDLADATVPDATIELDHTGDPHVTTSAALADGDGHWFHIASCDPVGNCSAAAHLGPFWIDTAAPTVTLVGSVEDTGDGVVAEDEVTGAALTALLVELDEPVADPAGDSDPVDVTNPATYRLVRDGGNDDVSGSTCATPADDDTVTAPPGPVTWAAGSRRATVTVSSGSGLASGLYRLLVCADGIADRSGTALDGNGDGAAGDDFGRTFQVVPRATVEDESVATCEALASADFVIVLSRPAEGPVQLGYATASESATAGEDFEPTTGTLQIVPPATAGTVSVALLDDGDLEGDETFRLDLSAPQGVELATASAWCTIDDTEDGTFPGDLDLDCRLDAGDVAELIATLDGHLPAGDPDVDGSGGTTTADLRALTELLY